MNRDEEIKRIRLLFKNHIITEEGNGWVMWHKSDTGINLIRYHVHKNILIVTGDLGDAVYQFGEAITLDWLAGCDLGYLASKCYASENGRGYKSWDSDKATAYLNGYFDENTIDLMEEEAKEETLCLLEEAKDIDDEHEWVAWLGHEDKGEQLFGEEWWQYCEIGMGPHIRCLYHLIGLKMMYEIKQKQNARDGMSEERHVRTSAGIMIRKETYPIETILPLIGEDGKKLIVTLGVDTVKMWSLRYRTFKAKGTKCVSCGIEGVYFAKERHSTEQSERYHLNLYALDKDGKEILMTKDHIRPRAKGGRNTLGNMQTMCTDCNNRKGDDWHEKKPRRKQKAKKNRKSEG